MKTTKGGKIKNEAVKAEGEKEEVIDPTQMPELSEEQKKKLREEFRKNFNDLYSKWATAEEEDADDDYIEQTKKIFNDAVEEARKTTFLIASENDENGNKTDNAIRCAKFIKDWNENYINWENVGWKGVVKFNSIISKIVEDLEANGGDFVIDYASLVFLYNAMANPRGCGLKSALAMAAYENCNTETFEPIEENVTVTYDSTLKKLNEHVSNLRNNDKRLNILRECINYAYAGIRITVKCETMEEWLEFNEAIVSTTEENNKNAR